MQSSNPPANYQPVSDQVEGYFIRFVQKNPSFSYEEVAYFINQNLPGLLPVSYLFLQRLISSYSELQPEGPNRYKLKNQEYIQVRKNDIQQMNKLIQAIGLKLGFSVGGDYPINWVSEQLSPNYKFFITASSIISQFKSKSDPGGFENVIVLPGSRAELLSYKMKNDPVYQQNFEKYHFVKFRHLRTISENPGVNFKTWVQILDSDPAIWQEANQPVLF